MNIDNDTPLIPELVAERVSTEPSFIAYASARARHLFQVNPHFRKVCKRVYGNQNLFVFMQHWYTAWAQKGGIQ